MQERAKQRAQVRAAGLSRLLVRVLRSMRGGGPRRRAGAATSFYTVAMVFLALLLAGMAAVWQVQMKEEHRQRAHDVVKQGTHLVSLLTLYPMEELDPERLRFFLRSLREYTPGDVLAYLVVHDAAGRPFISLTPGLEAADIPARIQTTSLHAMNQATQRFEPEGAGITLYEFAKPFFRNGEKSGTVRLGLRPVPVKAFSPRRLSLAGMVAFFMLATATVGYYLITCVIRRLRNVGPALSVSLAEGAAGAVPRMGVVPVLTHLDQSITDLKSRLKGLAASNAELTSRFGVASFERNQVLKLLDTMTFGVLTIDAQDRVTHMNRYLLSLLGKTAAEVLDRPLGEVIPNEALTAFVSVQSEVSGFRARDLLELEFQDLAPGESFEVSSLVLHDESDALTGKLVLVRNVTRQKLAAEAQKDFLANVTHEMMTPLTSLGAYSEMLMNDEVTDADARKEFYSTINAETQRLTVLIKNMLSISKMEMGGLTLAKGPVRTDQLLSDCLPAVEATALEKRIELRKQFPEKFPCLFADKELLKVAIINVLGNAVKYTPENGTVTFSVHQEDHTVIFDVVDTGCGIAEDDLPHVFDKFYRARDEKVQGQTGTGLGLAIASNIVSLHNGRIAVESQAGKGSHFAISLPLEEYTLESQ